MTRLKFRDLPERYFFCDPAAGKKAQTLKRTRARSAIVGVAPDPWNRLFVVHAWADRCGATALMAQILETCQQFQPTEFGIEANAMQSLFAELVQEEAVKQAKSLPLQAVWQDTKVDKLWRIRTTLQPVIAAGRLFVLDEAVELRTEIQSFPMSATLDLVDALASAVAMIPVRAKKARDDDEREALANYLRDAGVAPADLLERLAEYDREQAFRE